MRVGGNESERELNNVNNPVVPSSSRPSCADIPSSDSGGIVSPPLRCAAALDAASSSPDSLPVVATTMPHNLACQSRLGLVYGSSRVHQMNLRQIIHS